MKPHVEMSDRELLSESLRLAELTNKNYLNEARKANIKRQLSYVAFEVMCREADMEAFNRVMGAVSGTA